MNCDKCGRPSVYHSTLIINGVSETKNLCRECAIKEGVFSDTTSLFDDMFMSFAGISPMEQIENIVCPVCKTSLKDFKTNHRLGCTNCYEVFRPQIKEALKHIAPSTTHKQQVTVKSSSKQDKISALREELKLAVQEERYEDAGKIKKQIQKLEAKDE